MKTAAEPTRFTGHISFVNVDRGFGFITGPDHPGGVYFHRSSLVDLTLEEQLRERDVTFETFRGRRGIEAIFIKAAR